MPSGHDLPEADAMRRAPPSARSTALRYSLVYAIGAGAWILASDSLLGLLFSEPAALARAGALKGLLFVAITALLLFALLARRPPAAAEAPAPARPGWLAPGIAFLLFSAAVGGASYLVYRLAQGAVTQGINDKLAAIARLKTAQLEHWFEDQRREARVALESPLFADALRQWLQGGMREDALKARLLAHLQMVRGSASHVEVALHAASDGTRLMSASGRADAAHHRAHALAAATRETTVLEDFHLEDGDVAAIGLFVPLRVPGLARPPVVAHLEFDPNRSLYPLIREWPGSARSAETLLVRRDGDEVLFLNALRHRPDSALRLRLPMASARLPAALGLEGRAGFVSGTDYRGVPVLAYTMPVPGTPWVLVSKIDEAEAQAEVNRTAARTAPLIAILLLAAWWWWVERMRFAAASHRDQLERALAAARADSLGKEAAAALRASEARLKEAQRIAQIGSWELDLVGNRLLWSDEIFRMFEIDPARFGASYEAFLATVHPEDRARVDQAYTESVKNRTPYEVEHRLLFPGGRVKHVRERCETAYDETGRPLRSVGTALDITEYKRLEAQRAEYAHRVADLSRNLLATQEQERRRLALEIHDVVSPNLAAIQLNLGLVSAEGARTLSPEQESRLADCRTLLRETGESLREICANLRPAVLDYAGLYPALEDYARELSRRTGIAVRVSGPDSLRRLPTDTESLLYRIAQEALTNAAKHAQASGIAVELEQAEDRSVLTIADDGAGFDPAQLGRAGHKPGLGLLTMRERAESAGGGFSLESRPGEGTLIRVVIPHGDREYDASCGKGSIGEQK